MRKFRLVVGALPLIGAAWAEAATHSWITLGGGTYQVGSNWSGGVVPSGSDTAVFASPAADNAIILPSASIVSAFPVFSAVDTRIDLNQRSMFSGTLTVGGSTPASATIANGSLSLTTRLLIASQPGSGDGRLVLDAMRGTLGTSTTSQTLIGRVGGGTLVVTNNASLTVNGPASMGTTVFSTPTSGLIVEQGSRLRFTDGLLRDNGIVNVRSGGYLEFGDFAGGSAPDSVDVLVDGVGSTFVHNYQYAVGTNGRGSLAVTDGGQVILPGVPSDFLDGLMHIGMITATGTVTIDGTDSLIDTASQLTVGRTGIGHLLISNKGRMVNRPAPLNTVYTGAAAIGRDFSGVGTVVVSNAGSRWDVLGELSVAHEGIGTLNARDEGTVDAQRIRVANRLNGIGAVIIADKGKLVSQTHFNAGVESSPFGSNARITISSGGVLSVAGETRFNESSTLAIDGGRIDLNRGAMLWDFGTVDPTVVLTAHVAAGYAGGAWNGAGIITSAAQTDTRVGIAIADVDAWPSFLFAGETVDSTGVLLRVTLRGDTNANLLVDISDFSTLAANFNQAGTWRTGDFDYNNEVNIADFAALAANFNQSFAGDLPRIVPEPSAIAWASSMTFAYILRRRKRKTPCPLPRFLV